MTSDLDNGQVRELSNEVKQLSGDVRELKTEVKNLIEHVLPAITTQAGTIRDLDNKVVRLEGKHESLGDRVRENRTEIEAKVTALTLSLKERGDSNNRLIFTACTVTGVIITVVNVLIHIYQSRP